MKLNEAIEPYPLNKLKQIWVHVDKVLLSILIFVICMIAAFMAQAAPAPSEPVVNGLSPARRAGNVAVDARLTITFDQDIQLGTKGAITIYDSDDEVFESFGMKNPTGLSIRNEQLQISPSKDFLNDQSYYVVIDATVVTNGANFFRGYSDSEDWNFTTIDAPLALRSTVPVNYAIDVSLNDEVQLTFNKKIDFVAGSLTLKRLSDGYPIMSRSYTSTYNYSIDGATLSVPLNAHILQGETGYIEVSNGAIKTVGSEEYWEGITGNTTLRYTILDEQAHITNLSPDENSLDVGAGHVELEITFDELVKVNTLNPSVYYLRVFDSNDQQVYQCTAAQSNVTADGYVGRINLESTLFEPEATYYVTFFSGFFYRANDATWAKGIDDANTWTFTTRFNDNDGPALVSRYPEQNDTEIPRGGVVFSLTFDEPMNLGGTSSNYSLYKVVEPDDDPIYNVGRVDRISLSEDRRTVTTTSPYLLHTTSTYYLILNETGSNGYPVLYDDDGNAFAGFSTPTDWQFTTYGPATFESLFPTHESTVNDFDGVVTISGNHEMIKNTGTAYLRDYNTEIIITSTQISSDNVTVSGQTATIDFGPVNPQGHYYVTFPAASFRDENSQYYPHQSNKETWNFSSNDTQNPTVLSFEPADDNHGVMANTALAVSFSEFVRSTGTGTVTIHNGDGSVFEALSSENSSQVNFAQRNSVVLLPSTPLLKGNSYYITISNDAIEDYSDQPFAGISNSDTWNFSLAANEVGTTILLSNNSRDENVDSAAPIGELTTDDPDTDETTTFALVSGDGSEDNGLFYLQGANNHFIYTNEVFDFETKSSYNVRIASDDGHGGTIESELVIVVNNVIETGNDLLSFSFAEQAGPATINADHTIDIDVVVATDLTSLVPTYSISSGAAVLPASGDAQDFSAPFEITVTAEDNTDQIWTINTTRLQNTEANITDFSIPEETGAATINSTEHTVTIEVDAFAGPQSSAATVNRLTPTIETSFGATITPESGQYQYFYDGVPKTYTVTAEDGSTQDWQVTVNYALFPGGMYTVGIDGQFRYLVEAIDKISRSGIDGDVTLVMVEDAQSQQSEGLTSYDGSEDYTLTLTVDDGLSEAEISFGTLSIVGNDNVVIDGKGKLTIRSNRTPNNPALYISGSNHIEVRGVTFYGDGIDADGDDILIENCNFLVDDNTLTNVTAIDSEATNIVIRNNNILYGSILDNPSTALIMGIRLEDGGRAYNNFIHLNPSVAQSIYAFLYVDDVEIYNNTILIEGTSSSDEALYGFREITRSVDEPIIENNILSITRDPGSGGSKSALYFGTSATTISTKYENNNFYLAQNSGTLEYVWDRGTVYDDSNFSTLQESIAGLTNSQPLFTNVVNNTLTLTGASLTDGDLRGAPVAGITEDYFGTTRSTYLPSKGAHETPNTDTNIISFIMAEQAELASIDVVAGTVDIELVPVTDVTGLVPTIVVSGGATVSPSSGEAADFTNPVTYRVTAEDGSTFQDYVVSATVQPNTEANITDWTVAGMIGEPIIDNDLHTVEITVDPFTHYTHNPSVELSFGATVSPNPESSSNYIPGVPHNFTVTSEDGNTVNEWTVTVNYQPFASDIYSVGFEGDFDNLLVAFGRLSKIGVAGDVTLELIDETYTLSTPLTEHEDHLGHTLTIQPSAAVSSVSLNLGSSASALPINWQKLIIDGMGKMTINNTNTGSVIYLSNSNPDPSDFAIIKNLRIEGQNSSSRNHTTIENCEFYVEDNVNSRVEAFSLQGTHSLVKNNHVSFGSMVDNPAKFIYGFRVRNGGEAYNNFIHLNPTSVHSVYGIVYAPGESETNIHHNTVLIEGTASGNEIVYGISESGYTTDPMHVQNNLIVITRNPGAGGSKFGLRSASSSTVITHNNIYIEDNGGSLTYAIYNSTTYDNSNFSALQNAVAGTTRSQPVFNNVTNSDLKLSGSSLFDDDLRGTPIASITTDYFGDPRSIYLPSKGAHETPNAVNNIVSFSLPEQTGEATINPGDHTVTIEVPFSTDETTLTPTIDVSPGASISPEGGSPINFSSPVSFTVTAESNDTQQWTVEVTKADPLQETDFTAFSVQGYPSDADIDLTAHTIDYDIPFGVDLTALVPEFTLSTGATSSPASGVQHDFSTPQVYTVIAEDVSVSQPWTITMHLTNVAPTDIALDPSTIAENEDAGTLVGTVSGTDPNGDDLVFSLVEGANGQHGYLFEIDPVTKELKSKTGFDHESTPYLYIRIQADDQEGETLEKEFVVEVLDVDEIAPEVDTFSPSDGSGDVELAANLTITYNEPIQANSGNYRLISDGQVIESLVVGTEQVVIAGGTVTLNPTSNLLYHKNYSIEAFGGVVTDMFDNPAPAIAAGDWAFSAKGIITNLSPADDATDVSPFADLLMTFTEPVALQTEGTFRIFRKSDHEQIGENWDFDDAMASHNTVSFDIPIDLVPEVEVYLEIIGGIEDASGNPIDIVGSDTWNFTPVIQDQTVTLDPIAAKSFTAGPFSFPAATATSGLSIDYASSDPTVATVDGNFLTIVGAGSTTITATQEGNSYYKSAFAQQVFTVNKAEQSITFSGPPNMTYGDENHVLTAAVTPSGNEVIFEIISGDAVSLDTELNELTIIGTGDVMVRVTSLEDDNYQAPVHVERSFTVSKKTLNVSVNSETKVYGEANPDFVIVYDGFIEGEGASDLDVHPIVAFTDADENSNVGTHDIEFPEVIEDTNYNIETTWGTLTINPAQQVVTIEDITDKVKNEAPFDVIATVNSDTELQYVVSDHATNVGKTITLDGTIGTVTVIVTAPASLNYEEAVEQVTFEVNDKQTQQITFAIGDQTYGGEVVLSGSSDSSLPVSYEIVSGPLAFNDGVLTFTGVGAASVRATQEGDVIYNEAEPVLTEFSIDKATLTVTAQEQSIVYGAALPVLSVEYDGFANGENATELSELPAASTVATVSSDAGIYDIQLTGGVADNYALTLVGGTLTIEKATATVTLADLTHDEDGTAKSPAVSTDPADLTVVLTYNGATEAPSAAGTYEVIATIDETNYTGAATAILTINEVTVTGVSPKVMEIAVYPNPTSDWLAVSGLTDRSAQLSLIDIDGRLVHQQHITLKERVNVSSLKDGLYLLQLEQKDFTTTTKILIRK